MACTNKIVTCERGFECTKCVPDKVTESRIEIITFDADGALFPECAECDKGTPDDASILISPDDEGVFHGVKVCVVSLRDPDRVVIE